MFVYSKPRRDLGERVRRQAGEHSVGRNASIKRFSPTSAGQPLELFETRRSRLPVIVELLASPWIMRASDLAREGGSGAVKHAEQPVDVVWDAAHGMPASFSRDKRVYRIDAIVQMWATERAWWDPRRRVSRRFWRVLSRGGVYDLAYDRARDTWLLIGIQD
jgi:hypothetical protein